MRKIRKQILIGCLFMGIIVSVAGLIYIVTTPRIKTKELIRYSFNHSQGVSYEVHIKENELFKVLVQEEGNIYIKNIIDYITVNFNTKLQGSEVADLDLEYVLNAKVKGYSSGNDIRTDYWEKDIPLEEKQTIHIEADNLEEKKSIDIRLKEYDTVARNVNKLTGVNLSTELVVEMIGNITASTSYGTLVSPIDLKLNIPLQENLIQMVKVEPEDKTDQIAESISYEVEADVKYIGLLVIIIVVLMSGIVYALYIIKEPYPEDMVRNNIKKINKTYGSRMVALDSIPNKTFLHEYQVYSIKDLLVLSEDIKRPIYYVRDAEEIVKEYEYCVDKDGDIYRYREPRPQS